MTLAWPLALVLLVPFAALAIWVLWARHRAASVPFVELWRSAVKVPRSSRQFSPPPLSLIAILAAIVLGILAAAGPTVERVKSRPAVTLIVDRGMSMSARGRIDEVSALVSNLKFTRRISIPDDPPGGDGPTNVDTSAALQRTVAALLAHSSDVVVVLTDQALRDHPQLVTISPTRPVANVGITRLAIREHPTTQAMITLGNDSPLTSAELSVDSIHQHIDLPAAGGQRSYFIDLPTAPAKAQARIDVGDDFDGDNSAALARQHNVPAIEMRGSLAAEVRRVAQAYRSARPASDRSATIAIVASQDQLRDDQGGIISPAAASRINSRPTARIHPVTSHLDVTRWSDLRVAAAPVGDGWVPVVSADSKPLVAVREHPARQVWIGFTSADLPRTADFVILWTNALDWIGGGAAADISSIDMPRTHFGFTRSNEPGLEKLQSLLKPQSAGVHLAPYLSVAAAICALLAACGWPR